MNPEVELLRRVVVGLLDLVKEVQNHGHSARFAKRAPAIVEEATSALKAGTPTVAQPPKRP